MWKSGYRNAKNLPCTLVINTANNQNASEYLIEQPGARPLAAAAIAGPVGGKLDCPQVNWQIVPRFVDGWHPKNGSFLYIDPYPDFAYFEQGRERQTKTSLYPNIKVRQGYKQ